MTDDSLWNQAVQPRYPLTHTSSSIVVNFASSTA